MAETTREINITLTMDTNKRTVTETRTVRSWAEAEKAFEEIKETMTYDR